MIFLLVMAYTVVSGPKKKYMKKEEHALMQICFFLNINLTKQKQLLNNVFIIY